MYPPPDLQADHSPESEIPKVVYWGIKLGPLFWLTFLIRGLPLISKRKKEKKKDKIRDKVDGNF